MKIEDQIKVAEAVMPTSKWRISPGDPPKVENHHGDHYDPKWKSDHWKAIVAFLAHACKMGDLPNEQTNLWCRAGEAIANNDTDALCGLVLEIING